METGKGTEVSGISRRGFITAAAATGAVAAFAGLAGCSLSNGSASAANAPTGTRASEEATGVWAIDELGDPNETITCEVCVIGGGGTGLAAVIQAKQLGLDVIMLEKKGATGGSFIGFEGLFAVGSHWQEAAGINYSIDELAEACFDYHHWIVNPALYKSFFKRTAGTIA